MNLVHEQSCFMHDFWKLLKFAWDSGLVVTGGELWRPLEMQKLYVQQGKSKTMRSQHLDRLAIDLNFFRGSQLITKREELKFLGDYWEGLSPENRWGGSWRGLVESGQSKFIDVPHFERKV